MSILIRCLAVASAALIVSSESGKCDTFDFIKAKLRQSSCTEIQFLSIVSSTIFESVDTARGNAVFDSENRYRITLGQDEYIFNGTELYSFSASNQQATVERVDTGGQFGAEVSFVTRLDEIYKTHILRPDSSYRLVKKAQGYAGVPDSLVVTIDRKLKQIARIEYLDANEEPTTIVFQGVQYEKVCDPKEFVPRFPDSVKVIRLP
jgi:outer membrane lipoprotein-sorting protein